MVIFLTIVHVIVCVFLVLVVLLQSGKAADLAGAFGGMGSQTAFGPRGSATLLSKLTTFAAGAFMVTSLSLSIISTRTGGSSPSILDKKKPAATQTQPSADPSKGIQVKTTGPDGKSSTQTIPIPVQPTTPATPEKNPEKK